MSQITRSFNPFPGEINSGESDQIGKTEEPVTAELIKSRDVTLESDKKTKEGNTGLNFGKIEEQLEIVKDELDDIKKQYDQEVEKREKAEEEAEKLRKETAEKDRVLSAIQKEIGGIITEHHSQDTDDKEEKAPAEKPPIENPFSSN